MLKNYVLTIRVSNRIQYYRAMYLSYLISIITCIISLQKIEGANILIYLPILGSSHFKPFEPLFLGLAKRGHNVTVVSKFPPEEQTERYTFLPISEDIKVDKEVYTLMADQNRLENYIFIYKALQNLTQQYFQETRTRYLLTSELKFDLVMTELYHIDTFFTLANRFNAPIIGLSFQPHLPVYDWIIKNPIGLSYNPHLYLPFTNKMNLTQRLLNVFFGIFSILYYHLVSLATYQNEIEMLMESVNSDDVPRIEDVTKNLSLLLVESHFSVAYSRPQLPNVIEVAGIHILPPKSLPKDLLDFIEGDENGIIYVSMGSLINPNSVGNFAPKLISVLQKSAYRIVLKWDPSLVQNTSNMFARKWLPQSDILRHPKTKLFISHCGYHSIVETVNGGVPVLCLPFFTDQHHTAAMIENYEFGLKANFKDTEENLLKKVQELLSDQKYTENAKKRSKIFKDRPMDPLDQAIYWTEYVIRHEGAPHLKSAAVHLSWYEYLLLDVAAVMLLIVISIYFVTRRIINVLWKFIACKFFNTRTSKIKTE